jgi:DNA-binding PucR family transcriptional regulator
VAADDLLPERALAGDASAREQLIAQVFTPLAAAGGGLLETAETLLERSGSLEGAARALFVHANTVRYRIRRIAEVSGQPITQPRGAFTLHLALGYGRLAAADTIL